MERASRGIRIRGEEEEAPEGTYTIEALCENCDWLGEVEIPKGIAITRGESIGRYARCDDCGCYTLLRCVPAEEVEEEAVAPIGQEAAPPQYDEEADHLEELLRRMREQDIARWDAERSRRYPPAPVAPFPAHPMPLPVSPPPEPWHRPNRDGVWVGDPPPDQRTRLECDNVGEAGGILPASQVQVRKIHVDLENHQYLDIRRHRKSVGDT